MYEEDSQYGVELSDEVGYNPNNKEHVDAKKDEEIRRKQRIKEAYKSLLVSQGGRELLLELKKFCGTNYVPIDSKTKGVYMKIGMLNVGRFIDDSLRAADPIGYLKLIREEINDYSNK